MFGRPNDVVFAGQPAEMADAEKAIRLERPFDFLDRPVFIEGQPRLARRNRIERCGVEAGVLRRRHPKISQKAKPLSAVPGFKNLSCRYIDAGDTATLLSEAQSGETHACTQIENALTGKAHSECSEYVKEAIRDNWAVMRNSPCWSCPNRWDCRRRCSPD